MQTQWLKDELSPVQIGVLRAFYRRTVAEELDVFSSDDFRRLGYDIYLRSGNLKEIGTLFGFMKRMGWIREVGQVRTKVASSHSRRIGQYRWAERGTEVLGKGSGIC